MSYSVAVIIPCYKDSQTLARAIDSVLAQTRPVDEIIVVNDCSPETAAIDEVMQGYPAVKYVRNQVNVGLAASRNVGLHTATTELVSYLDADDEIHPQKIELQLTAYEPSIAVSCLAKIVRTDADRASVGLFGKDFAVKEMSSSKDNILKNRMVGASILISRELLLKLGGYDANLRSSEDFDLWLRILDDHVMVRDVQLPLYFYYYNENGLSKNFYNISYWETQAFIKYFSSNGKKFLDTAGDAYRWGFILVKQMFRYEKAPDAKLQALISENIQLISKRPLLRTMLKMIQKARLLKLLVKLKLVH